MRVFAFPGDFAKPRHLKADMGDPPWIDEYIDYRKRDNWISKLTDEPRVFLVGYSRGGDVIANLSHLLPNIAGAIVCESPVMGLPPARNFPVRSIWNSWMYDMLLGHKEARTGRAKRRLVIARKSVDAWSTHRNHSLWRGNGRHIRLAWRPLPLAHNWDAALNDQCAEFIESVRTPKAENDKWKQL